MAGKSGQRCRAACMDCWKNCRATGGTSRVWRSVSGPEQVGSRWPVNGARSSSNRSKAWTNRTVSRTSQKKKRIGDKQRGYGVRSTALTRSLKEWLNSRRKRACALSKTDLCWRTLKIYAAGSSCLSSRASLRAFRVSTAAKCPRRRMPSATWLNKLAGSSSELPVENLRLQLFSRKCNRFKPLLNSMRTGHQELWWDFVLRWVLWRSRWQMSGRA
mmetsp:Transcript_61109/g.162319  ORF Transcript_61109/g.162319 Transcript_61109/m.162319 type:complete len:216 (-) Transcript_61109:1640-2287(-)